MALIASSRACQRTPLKRNHGDEQLDLIPAKKTLISFYCVKEIIPRIHRANTQNELIHGKSS